MQPRSTKIYCPLNSGVFPEEKGHAFAGGWVQKTLTDSWVLIASMTMVVSWAIEDFDTQFNRVNRSWLMRKRILNISF